MTDADLDRRVEAVRRFNRFYTSRIGVLEEGLLRSPFSLPEARVVYELAQREPTTATEVGRELGMDAGYLSRILRTLEARGIVEKTPSPTDGRQNHLSLSAGGRAAFASLDAASRGEIGAMLKALPPAGQQRLVEAMHGIERLLGARADGERTYSLRPHRPGDMGWVVQRHGELYWDEYGWDERFEALVAGVVAGFIGNLVPERERCWIAEVGGERAGCVFVVRDTGEVAKLRLLLLEPWARGMGLGRRLVEEAVAFAREAGYRRMTLWTNDVLLAARHIYQSSDFHLARTEVHNSFGQDLVAETWEREL